MNITHHVRRMAATAAALLALGAASAARAELPRYRLIGLTESPTLRMDYATRLNNEGDVIGTGYFNSTQHVYMAYAGGRLQPLQVDSARVLALSDLNDHGDLAGSLFTERLTGTPFITRGGRVLELGAAVGQVALGNTFALNNAGHAVGWYTRDNLNLQQFYFDGQRVHTLDFDYGFVDINDRDVLLNGGGFLYDHGRIEQLPSLGQGFGRNYVTALNNAGQVVGAAEVSGAFSTYAAYLYGHGTMTNLGNLGGGNADARGLNDAGWVAGRSRNASGDWDAFLWADGTMHNVEDLLAPSQRGRWDFETAEQVNDRGQILVLNALGGDTFYGAALLTPVPELPSQDLMLAGLGVLGAAARRLRGRGQPGPSAGQP